jgi:hypothetical protein
VFTLVKAGRIENGITHLRPSFPLDVTHVRRKSSIIRRRKANQCLVHEARATSSLPRAPIVACAHLCLLATCNQWYGLAMRITLPVCTAAASMRDDATHMSPPGRSRFRGKGSKGVIHIWELSPVGAVSSGHLQTNRESRANVERAGG